MAYFFRDRNGELVHVDDNGKMTTVPTQSSGGPIKVTGTQVVPRIPDDQGPRYHQPSGATPFSFVPGAEHIENFRMLERMVAWMVDRMGGEVTIPDVYLLSDVWTVDLDKAPNQVIARTRRRGDEDGAV